MTQENGLTVGQPYKAGQNYDKFQAQVQATFERNYSKYGPILLRSNGRGMSTLFLNMLNEADGTRQHHNCACCRDFIREYGNAYFVDEQGNQIAAMWEVNGDLPAEYRDAVAALKQRVESQPGSYLLATTDETLGRARAGNWDHLHVKTPTTLAALAGGRPEHVVRRDSAYRYGEFMEALAKATVAQYRELARLFESGALEDRAGYSQWTMWLLKLAVLNFETDLRTQQKRNLTMAVLAQTPANWQTFRSGAVGEVLDGIIKGKPFEAIKYRYEDMTASQNYQRPKAAPSEANVKDAERLIAELGLASAMKRRPATWAEVSEHASWVAPSEPAAEQHAETGSVFGALLDTIKETNEKQLSIPPVEITWVRFVDEVLPKAKSVDLVVPPAAIYGAFMGPVDPDAGRLFYYESETRRNPYSWWVRARPESSHVFGLEVTKRAKMLGVVSVPAMWDPTVPGVDRFKQQILLVIEGCETKENISVGLFPELLRSELHAVRGTIEAYNNATPASPAPAGQKAMGVFVTGGLFLVVTTELGELNYVISGYH